MLPMKNVPSNVRLIVAAALIRADGLVLVQKRRPDRAMPNLWEFPGGKLEAGETPEFALIRELKEELGIETRRADFTPLCFASEATAGSHMILLLYICRKWQGTPTALDAVALQWCKVSALHNLEMPPADMPFISALEALTGPDGLVSPISGAQPVK